MRHTSNRQYLQSYILTHVTTSTYVTTISLVENSYGVTHIYSCSTQNNDPLAVE